MTHLRFKYSHSEINNLTVSIYLVYNQFPLTRSRTKYMIEKKTVIGEIQKCYKLKNRKQSFVLENFLSFTSNSTSLILE